MTGNKLDRHQKGSKENPVELGIGDRIWICDADEPSSFEQMIGNKLSQLFEEKDNFVFLTLLSISPSVLNKDDLNKAIEFEAEATKVFLIRCAQGEEAKTLDVSIRYKVEEAEKAGTTVLIDHKALKFNDEYFLVVSHPFSEAKLGGVDRHYAHIETGLLACFFGRAIQFPAVYTGFFSMKQNRFYNADTQMEAKRPLDQLAKSFDEISRAGIDFSEDGANLTSGLSMVSLAVRSRDRVAKWVYYRAALEQIFGRNHVNAIRKYYKRQTKAKEVAETAISHLKTLRDDVVHNALVGEQSAFDERVLQAIILDGVFNSKSVEKSYLAGMLDWMASKNIDEVDEKV